MLCPSCESEFVDGVSECPTCGVSLVNEVVPVMEPDSFPPTPEPAVVFSSFDAGAVAIAKSLLQSSGISYGVIGERVQDLFGYGRFPAGGSVFAGPIKLVVPAEDAADATELLAMLAGDAPAVASEGDLVDEYPRSSWWDGARTAGRIIGALMLLALLGEMVFTLFSR